MKSVYRADIDGLRAVAVISVMLFHLGVAPFRGGFAGVDVFFVISGFLITRLIRDEVLATGTFSFSRFFVRRVRRLFPALFTTLLVSSAAATLLLSPPRLTQFGESLIATVVSVSNFYFWRQAGYFATAAELRPLLHTWSLGIEEQFYLLWPAVLVLLLRAGRRGWAPLFLVVAGAASLCASVAVSQLSVAEEAQAAAFFLLPFRVFEFAIGAILVWLVPHAPRKRFVLEPILLAGLGLIGYAVFAFSDQTPFPSYHALIPCAGAALAIYAGRAPLLGKLLRNPLSVQIGLVSYSLYLVHWPLLVFVGYWRLGPLTLPDRLVITALSFTLAAVMYRYVEKPFRAPATRRSGRLVAASVAALSASLAVSGYSMVHDDGWPWRIDQDRRLFGLGKNSIQANLFGGAGVAVNKVVVLGAAGTPPRFLIAGDSFALQYANAIGELLESQRMSALGLFDHGCLVIPDSTTYIRGREDKGCSSEYGKLQRILAEHPRLDLFLAENWHAYVGRLGPRGGEGPFDLPAPRYIRYLTSQVEQVVTENGRERNYFLIGAPQGSGSEGRSVLDCLYRPALLSSNCEPYSKETRPARNRALARLSEKYARVFYVEPRDAFCKDGLCADILDGRPVHSDGTHLSMTGARRFVDHFRALFVGDLLVRVD